MVVGYGMAAAVLPRLLAAGGPPTWVLAPATDPLPLARPGPERADHPAAPAGRGPAVGRAGDAGRPAPAAGSHTWAEWAWLFVGSYWIVLGLFVIPARLHEFGPGDALLFGLVPILAALVSGWSAPTPVGAGEAGLDPRGGRLAARDLAGRVGLPGRRGPRASLSIAPLHGIRDS